MCVPVGVVNNVYCVVMVTGLFGERPADRAGRLRALLGEQGIIAGVYSFSL